jgi:hypothetical protein
MKKKILLVVVVMAISFTNICKAQPNDNSKQVALNFMNALIELDYEKASVFKSKKMDTTYWQGIVAYCKAVKNGQSYKSSYDLDKLRHYKYVEDWKLTVFKVENFETGWAQRCEIVQDLINDGWTFDQPQA